MTSSTKRLWKKNKDPFWVIILRMPTELSLCLDQKGCRAISGTVLPRACAFLKSPPRTFHCATGSQSQIHMFSVSEKLQWIDLTVATWLQDTFIVFVAKWSSNVWKNGWKRNFLSRNCQFFSYMSFASLAKLVDNDNTEIGLRTFQYGSPGRTPTASQWLRIMKRVR